MKKFLPLVALCLVGWGLFESKPVAEDRYVAHVAGNFQSLRCSAASISEANCRRLRPFFRPAVRWTIALYTDDVPRDYIFFTHYITRLPRQTIHGVGIAGQFIIWTDGSSDGETCNIFYDNFLSDPSQADSPSG
ncbi:MAG: hypothetical protein WBB01_15355 [Phormidesmis sp.]